MNYISNIVLAVIIILLAIDIYFTKSTMNNTKNYFDKQRILIQEKIPTEELFIIDEEVLWI